MKLGIGRALTVAAIAFALAGCPPSASNPQARDEARGIELTFAHAVAVADQACATWGEGEAKSGDPTRIARARDVVGKCNVIAHRARDAALAAEVIVDAWDASSTGKLACVLSVAVPDLASMRAILADVGVTIPLAVDDGIVTATKLAAFVAGTCSAPPVADAAQEGG